MDGAKTNANRATPHPSAKAIVIFDLCRDTRCGEGGFVFRVIDVQVDIHTGHDISGIGLTSSAGAADVDMNNLVDQTSPGCISLHQALSSPLFFFLSLPVCFCMDFQAALTPAPRLSSPLLSKSCPVKPL